MIAESILKKYKARVVSYDKGGEIFPEGGRAEDFFFVRHGRIKMQHLTEGGKEFVQGYFTDGQSFGEPPFFTQQVYPASAVAEAASEVWRIDRASFFKLLRDHADIHLEITRTLASRLIYKATMLSELASEEAEHRVETLLTYIWKGLGKEGSSTIPFSRQQLADMGGLRVETVIRIVKSLEKKGILKISRHGKIVMR